MARSIWTGTISFGLVSIPVKLYSATESHRVSFHEFEAGTGQRIRHRRVAEKSGREVPWDKIQKGFEVGKGRYVMLTDEELDAAEPRKSRTIDIEQFVSLDEIDPVTWDQTYYVAPDGPQAVKPFNLLREAMKDRGGVAIGRFVMRTKEYVVCIRPFDNILALHTMFFPDEVRSPKELGAGKSASAASVSQRERTMAGQLIDSLTAKWDPTKFKDTFTARVMQLVRKKDKGQEIALPPAKEKAGKVLDLMEALKATLAGQTEVGAGARAAGAREKRQGPATTRRGARGAASRGKSRGAASTRSLGKVAARRGR
jgi:DNA end-binding protein Ku